MARVKMFIANPNTGSLPNAADVLYFDSIKLWPTNEKAADGTEIKSLIVLTDSVTNSAIEIELTQSEADSL